MPTSIRLSSDAEKRLDYLVSHTGRSKSFYLRELIENGLEDLEDYYLASNVLENIRKGKEKIHSASDVRKDLDLED